MQHVICMLEPHYIPRLIQSETSYLVWQTNLWPNHLQSATLKSNYWVSTQHVNYNDTTILRYAVDLPRLRKDLSQHIDVALRLCGFISTYTWAWQTWCFQRNRLGAECKKPSARTSRICVPHMHATPHLEKPHNKGKDLLHRMNATKLWSPRIHKLTHTHNTLPTIQTYVIPNYTTAAESFRQAQGWTGASKWRIHWFLAIPVSRGAPVLQRAEEYQLVHTTSGYITYTRKDLSIQREIQGVKYGM